MKTHLWLFTLCVACTGKSADGESPPASPRHRAQTEAPRFDERDEPTPRTEDDDEELPEAPSVTQEQIDAAAKSIDAFSLDFYGRVASGSDNLIVSPASVAIALAMTHPGAKGETADELAGTLHVTDSGLPPQQWWAAMGGLLERWNGLKDREQPEHMPELKLAVANRLFGDQATDFHRSYLDRVARDFRAPLETVDFRSAAEQARARINGWVEKQTFDRIQDLVPAGGVNASTRLVLVNAVYFKAQWVHTFEEHATKPRPFFVDGRTEVDVPMMDQTKHHKYASLAGDGLAIVELPYESGPFAMDVLVPTKKEGLAAIEAKLDVEHLETWIGSLSGQRVRLQLPKFRIDPPESMRLAEPLVAMGLATAFDSTKADFTAMAPPAAQIVLDEAFHKAFIEVDENGTEAAAATAIVARAGAAPPTSEPIDVIVDRPFLFLVRDTRSGAILFMGRVTDPR